ncbi:hypothetical protein HS5_01750 [Acidianus sp. HS-5]|nr:hypothetical protein HS5_01750 [Acidianus sp. HS-5]
MFAVNDKLDQGMLLQKLQLPGFARSAEPTTLYATIVGELWARGTFSKANITENNNATNAINKGIFFFILNSHDEKRSSA